MGDRLMSFLKIMCIFYLVLFLPRIISLYNDKLLTSRPVKPTVTLGIENLAYAVGGFDEIKISPVGLVVEGSSYDQQGNRTADLLVNNGFLVKKIAQFRREAMNDVEAAESKVLETTDYKTKLPLFCLNNPKFRPISANFFNDVEAVVVDIQDHGLRDDPGANLLLEVMQCAAEHKKKVIVADRVNPLGYAIEGPGEIPLRHGMTIGELATFYNLHVLRKKADLLVVPMIGWRRNDPLKGAFVKNLRPEELFENCLHDLLKEIKPLQIVREDDCPTLLFPPQEELSEWESNYLKDLCQKLALQAVDSSYWSSEHNQLLKGVKLRLQKGATSFSAFNTALTLIRFLKNRKGISVSYSKLFDKVMGSQQVRRFFEGKIKFAQLKKDVEKHAKNFYEKSQKCFMYEPLPHISQVNLGKS